MKIMQDGIDNRVALDDGTVGYDDGTGVVRVRYGWDTIDELAKRLCVLVGTLGTLIRRGFGDNPYVVALLEIIDLLCPLVTDVAGGFARGDDQTGQTITTQEVATRLRSIADTIDGGGA